MTVTGDVIYESARRFEIWDFGVGHRGMLLRSNPTPFAFSVSCRDDAVMALMRGVAEPGRELSWLADRPDIEAVTGYDAQGWESSTWLLHAMYENPSLPTEVTHHQGRQSRIAEGLIEPLIIGEVNLDEKSTVTGTRLGFVVRRAHRGSDFDGRTTPREQAMH